MSSTVGGSLDELLDELVVSSSVYADLLEALQAVYLGPLAEGSAVREPHKAAFHALCDAHSTVTRASKAFANDLATAKGGGFASQSAGSVFTTVHGNPLLRAHVAFAGVVHAGTFALASVPAAKLARLGHAVQVKEACRGLGLFDMLMAPCDRLVELLDIFSELAALTPDYDPESAVLARAVKGLEHGWSIVSAALHDGAVASMAQALAGLEPAPDPDAPVAVADQVGIADAAADAAADADDELDPRVQLQALDDVFAETFADPSAVGTFVREADFRVAVGPSSRIARRVELLQRISRSRKRRVSGTSVASGAKLTTPKAELRARLVLLTDRVIVYGWIDTLCPSLSAADALSGGAGRDLARHGQKRTKFILDILPLRFPAVSVLANEVAGVLTLLATPGIGEVPGTLESEELLPKSDEPSGGRRLVLQAMEGTDVRSWRADLARIAKGTLEPMALRERSAIHRARVTNLFTCEKQWMPRQERLNLGSSLYSNSATPIVNGDACVFPGLGWPLHIDTSSLMSRPARMRTALVESRVSAAQCSALPDEMGRALTEPPLERPSLRVSVAAGWMAGDAETPPGVGEVARFASPAVQHAAFENARAQCLACLSVIEGRLERATRRLMMRAWSPVYAVLQVNEVQHMSLSGELTLWASKADKDVAERLARRRMSAGTVDSVCSSVDDEGDDATAASAAAAAMAAGAASPGVAGPEPIATYALTHLQRVAWKGDPRKAEGGSTGDQIELVLGKERAVFKAASPANAREWVLMVGCFLEYRRQIVALQHQVDLAVRKEAASASANSGAEPPPLILTRTRRRSILKKRRGKASSRTIFALMLQRSAVAAMMRNTRRHLVGETDEERRLRVAERVLERFILNAARRGRLRAMDVVRRIEEAEKRALQRQQEELDRFLRLSGQDGRRAAEVLRRAAASARGGPGPDAGSAPSSPAASPTPVQLSRATVEAAARTLNVALQSCIRRGLLSREASDSVAQLIDAALEAAEEDEAAMADDCVFGVARDADAAGDVDVAAAGGGGGGVGAGSWPRSPDVRDADPAVASSMSAMRRASRSIRGSISRRSVVGHSSAGSELLSLLERRICERSGDMQELDDAFEDEGQGGADQGGGATGGPRRDAGSGAPGARSRAGSRVGGAADAGAAASAGGAGAGPERGLGVAAFGGDGTVAELSAPATSMEDALTEREGEDDVGTDEDEAAAALPPGPDGVTDSFDDLDEDADFDADLGAEFDAELDGAGDSTAAGGSAGAQRGPRRLPSAAQARARHSSATHRPSGRWVRAATPAKWASLLAGSRAAAGRMLAIYASRGQADAAATFLAALEAEGTSMGLAGVALVARAQAASGNELAALATLAAAREDIEASLCFEPGADACLVAELDIRADAGDVEGTRLAAARLTRRRRQHAVEVAGGRLPPWSVLSAAEVRALLLSGQAGAAVASRAASGAATPSRGGSAGRASSAAWAEDVVTYPGRPRGRAEAIALAEQHSDLAASAGRRRVMLALGRCSDVQGIVAELARACEAAARGDGVVVDGVTFGAAIEACGVAGDVATAEGLFTAGLVAHYLGETAAAEGASHWTRPGARQGEGGARHHPRVSAGRRTQ
ncbi:hypothetical protein FNF27_05651 [Cafeteria roenbergensis]|uniref:DH domain-containing protein n=1 Tax=Cafeteria roenbergensis TaxID=33653 RepID=A0A5A8E596_CAFRO|nr:hypothetical protein FNF27_05651 [Cafeteria roenbergensis]